MLTIQLRDLSFEAFHGIYDEERLIGNNYSVNCSVKISEPDGIIRQISNTIDYGVLFKIIKKRMSIPTPLLETVAMETGELIHQRFPEILSISIEIVKLHPLLEGFAGNSSVKWDKDYAHK